MNPILKKGYVSIGPWPCRERQFRVWHVELRSNEEILPVIEYANRTKRIPEELGEFFFWLATRYGERKPYKFYNDFEDHLGFVVMFLCSHALRFNPHVSQNAVGYFIQVAAHAFAESVRREHKQFDIKQKVAEEMDIQCLEHFYELYDCAW